ncbi:MAG: hypothetical protein IJG42_10650 [Muribaculaceae bacterium]|nr:hypothetical protein [Muribaculaceae bacterium]
MVMIKKLFFSFRYKRAVKKANRLAQETGLKYYVIVLNGSIHVVPKQVIKQLIRQHRFRKGTKLADIEKLALHITK